MNLLSVTKQVHKIANKKGTWNTSKTGTQNNEQNKRSKKSTKEARKTVHETVRKVCLLCQRLVIWCTLCALVSASVGTVSRHRWEGCVKEWGRWVCSLKLKLPSPEDKNTPVLQIYLHMGVSPCEYLSRPAFRLWVFYLWSASIHLRAAWVIYFD